MSEEHRGGDAQGHSESTERTDVTEGAAALEAAGVAQPEAEAEPAAPAATEAGGSTAAAGSVDVSGSETIASRTQVEVALVRSVRHGRIILTATVVGAALGMIAALLFPVEVGADYELGQIVGLMAVVGAVGGLVLGSVLALVLGVVAKRRRGAALAIQTDVQ